MLAATMYTFHSELGSQGISDPWESYGSVGSVVFLDGDNFCKAFAGAQVNLS